uniref:Uncharacterized protein n=1 Tax=viral metagenome TaxID=1070528 RepID=A0A6C0C421_9ZZZZ
MSHLELNISEYDYEDLLKLFDIDNPRLDNIQEKHRMKMQKINKIKDTTLKKNLDSFLNQAYNVILDKINEENRLSHIPLPQKSNTVTSHDVIEIEEPSTTSTFPLKYPLGSINPVERKTITQLISLDTLFRDLSLYPNSTDFIINLPNPIENVISMKLIAAEIPNSFPLYSEAQGNNKCIVTITSSPTLEPLSIILVDGSPSFLTTITYINNVLDSQRNEYSFLTCGIDNISGKFFFRFKTLIEIRNWTASYYSTSTIDSTPPDNKPPTSFNPTPNYGLSTTPHADWDASLNNINYTINLNPYNQKLIKSFGWALGFREPKGRIINFDDTLTRGNITYNGYFEANTPYSDAESDYMFLYVDDFVGNYNDNLSSILNDNNFFSKSLLARMKVSVNFYAVEFHETQMINILEKTREYFGPVNIKKLHIKLIDKFGDLVGLMNSNYSLTLQFEKLYSSIRN